jgi:hypothetical protein
MNERSSVDHPVHYGGSGNPYEVIKVIHEWKLHTSFALGNAIKYIARAGHKSADTYLEDLQKARWYLEWEIERVQEMQRLRGNEAKV